MREDYSLREDRGFLFSCVRGCCSQDARAERTQRIVDF